MFNCILTAKLEVGVNAVVTNEADIVDIFVVVSSTEAALPDTDIDVAGTGVFVAPAGVFAGVDASDVENVVVGDGVVVVGKFVEAVEAVDAAEAEVK